MAARLLLMSDGGSGSENADQALRPERADGASSLARTQRAQGVSDSDGKWDESKHPREENGQFASGGGSASNGENASDPSTAEHEYSDLDVHTYRLHPEAIPESHYFKEVVQEDSGKYLHDCVDAAKKAGVSPQKEEVDLASLLTDQESARTENLKSIVEAAPSLSALESLGSPIEVAEINGDYMLIDGNHRTIAAKLYGAEKIQANVYHIGQTNKQIVPPAKPFVSAGSLLPSERKKAASVQDAFKSGRAARDASKADRHIEGTSAYIRYCNDALRGKARQPSVFSRDVDAQKIITSASSAIAAGKAAFKVLNDGTIRAKVDFGTEKTGECWTNGTKKIATKVTFTLSQDGQDGWKWHAYPDL